MNEPRTPTPSLAATVFFTVTGNVSLFLATLVFGLAASVVGWLPPRGKWMYLCARIWSYAVLWTSGVRTRSHFEKPLSPEQGYVVMANHESLMDGPLLMTTLPGEMRALAKRPLFRLPVFGWALRAGGFISVDHKDRTKAAGVFTAAVRLLEQGSRLLVFPEESRTLDGRLQPFKSGGFLMALKTGYPIVPVGIRGTLQVRKRGSFVIRPGRVEIHYGKPIDVRAYGVRKKAQLMEDVRARVLELRDGSADPA